MLDKTLLFVSAVCFLAGVVKGVLGRGLPTLAMGLLANDRFPEAIAQARLAIGEFPPDSDRLAETAWLALISAESENGQDAEAQADLQTFLSTSRTLHTMPAIRRLPFLAGNPQLLEGPRRAGMPAE